MNKPVPEPEVNDRFPHNEEIEQALLGALMVDPDCYEQVCDYLRPEHFFHAVHGRIYAAIQESVEIGKDPSPKVLRQYFVHDPDLAHVAGGEYLLGLAESVVSTLTAGEHGALILELHLRRGLIAFGAETAAAARRMDLSEPIREQVTAAEQRLYELGAAGSRRGSQQWLSDASAQAVETAAHAFKHGKRPGIATGWPELDRELGGLHPENLVILAGSTSMGKTAFAVNLGVHAAQELHAAGSESCVAYFSLEMSAEEIATRILADVSGVGLERLRKGDLGEREYLEVLEAQQKVVKGLPLMVDETPALSVPQLRLRARRLQRKHGLRLILVDYLQLMDPSKYAETRVQEVTEITRGLKAVAKELRVPIVALSQLNRSMATRENKRPQLADLRDSGSIEQDADVVLLLHRDHYYVEKEKPMQGPEEKRETFEARYERWQERERESFGKAEVVIAKQRQGPTGTVSLRFDEKIPRFYSRDRRQPMQRAA